MRLSAIFFCTSELWWIHCQPNPGVTDREKSSIKGMARKNDLNLVKAMKMLRAS